MGQCCSANTTDTGSKQIGAFGGEEDPYPTYTMEEVVSEGAGGFHNIVKNGYGSIPPLDPLKPGSFSREIKNQHVKVKFTLNDPVIKGLDSIQFVEMKDVNFQDGVEFSVSFKFLSDICLLCDDYDREGSLKPLFFEHDITKLDRSLDIRFSDVCLNLTFNVEMGESGVQVLVVEKDDNVTIGKIISNIEDSVMFNIIAPFFKNFIAHAISRQIDDVLANFLTDRLRAIGEQQKEMISMFNELYKMKKTQGLLHDTDGNEVQPRIRGGFGDVGQVAYPMFWNLPEIPEDKLGAHMTISDVVANAKTGDLLMFQGVASGAKVIRRFTQTPYSHTMFIIREKNFLGGKPVICHAISGEYYCILSKKRFQGIMVNDIEQFMIEYDGNWGTRSEYAANPAKIAFRSLNKEKIGEKGVQKKRRNSPQCSSSLFVKPMVLHTLKIWA